MEGFDDEGKEDRKMVGFLIHLSHPNILHVLIFA